MIDVALKEWHLLCQALIHGEQAIVLRKGGILEANNEFELEYRRFLLYPTYIHQQVTHVKPEWQGRIEQRAAEPEKIALAGYAEAVKIFEVPSRAAFEQLDDLHMWAKPLIDMRFSYRPEKPLYLVVVRAFKLAAPLVIDNTPEYAGCKSWVPLAQMVDVSGATPALAEARVAAVVERIGRTFAEARP